MIIVMCNYWDGHTTHLCLSIIYLQMLPICSPAHPLHRSDIPPWPCGQPDVATLCFDERFSHQFLPTFARFVVGDPWGQCGGFPGHQIKLGLESPQAIDNLISLSSHMNVSLPGIWQRISLPLWPAGWRLSAVYLGYSPTPTTSAVYCVCFGL